MPRNELNEELRDLGHRFQLQDGTEAVLRRISAAGMYIETGAPLRVGQELDFELSVPGSAIAFSATGVIARQGPSEHSSGYQVRFTSLRLRSAD